MKSIIKNVIILVILILCIILVVYGQKSIGYMGLGSMLLGLIGILILLYLYNKNYK